MKPSIAAILIVLAGFHGWAAAPVIPAVVQTAIRNRVDYSYNPSIVVGMVNPDGRTYFSYGKRLLPDGNLPDENTLYEVGSITKVFTALLLAEMANRGDLALTNTVQSLMPSEVQIPARQNREISLLHLATHSSGLPYIPPGIEYDSPLNPFATYTQERLYNFLNDFTLPRLPGTVYEYSNLGFGLLGHALSLKLGKSYEAALKERIIGPMGLIDTTTAPTTEQNTRRATGYSGVVPRPPFDMNILESAGDLVSSASDLLTFLEFHMGIRTNALKPALDDAMRIRRATDIQGMNIGLGWLLLDLPSGTYVNHSGNTMGQTAFVAFRRGSRTGVVVLTNSRVNQYSDITDIGLRLLDSSFPLTTIRKPAIVPSETLALYQGVYRADDGTWFNFGLINGFLSMEFSIGRGAAYTMVPDTTNRFTFYEAGGSGSGTFHGAPGAAADSMTWRQSGITSEYSRMPSGHGVSTELLKGKLRVTITGAEPDAYQLEESTDLMHWIFSTATEFDLPQASQKYFRATLK